MCFVLFTEKATFDASINMTLVYINGLYCPLQSPHLNITGKTIPKLCES